MWEGVGDRTELQHIDPLTLIAISASFPFSRAGFLYHSLSPKPLVSKLADFLSSPSYIIVQSPTQYLPITGHRNVSLPPSLEWHVWSSSSGNNCHAVHGSLSSGASVWLYRGILTLSHIVSQACPHHWNMHFRRLWNGMFGAIGGQYTTFFFLIKGG